MSLSGSDVIDGLAASAQKVERWGRRRKRVGIQALGSQAPSLGLPTVSSGRVSSWFGILVFSNVVFNLTDLATTAAALGNGLSEGNALVLTMSSTLGVNLLVALVAMKAIFVTGAVVIALVGARSSNSTLRNAALCYLITSTVVFYAVSMNNVFWIFS
jgi:hypothetical protein